jgi:hypothetical protein
MMARQARTLLGSSGVDTPMITKVHACLMLATRHPYCRALLAGRTERNGGAGLDHLPKRRS